MGQREEGTYRSHDLCFSYTSGSESFKDESQIWRKFDTCLLITISLLPVDKCLLLTHFLWMINTCCLVGDSASPLTGRRRDLTDVPGVSAPGDSSAISSMVAQQSRSMQWDHDLVLLVWI